MSRADRRARIRDDRTRWGATRVFAQHFAAIARRSGIRRRAGETRRRPCHLSADAGGQGSLAVLVLDHGHGDQGADRGHAARRDGTAAIGLGGEQPARTRSTTSPTRTSATFTTTGWRCCPRPRIATGRFVDVWRWKRGWRRNLPWYWRRRRHRRRRDCCGRSPSFRCAAATSTIPRQTSPQWRRRFTTASATTSNRSRSLARAARRIARALSPLPGRTGRRDAKACRRGRAAGARRAVR